MATGGGASLAEATLMEEVLTTYCSDHIKQMYATLDQDAKSKLLLALRSVLEIEQHYSLTEILAGEFNGYNPVKHDQHPVLTRALRSVGYRTILKEYSQLEQMLKSWGMPEPFIQAVYQHHLHIERDKSMGTEKNPYPWQGKVSSKACTKTAVANVDFTNLEKIFIRDLKLFQTATGKYLEGRLVTPPAMKTGVATWLEDDNGDYVLCAFYNIVTSGPMRWEIAEKKFPVGMNIKISQPFYKIFAGGNPGIRVDSPADVYRDIPNSQLTVDEVRSRGKELMEAGEYFEALELYLEGLKTTQIEALLNNRSQAEIKLEQYEEALQDAASVLLFSNNTKANQRYMMAAQKLGFNKDDKTSIFSVWKQVLQHQRKEECVPDLGTKERGNEAFKQGNYEEAKQNYSSALKDSEACVLLNNIVVVCLKVDLFHTAISAASACLQMSTQAKIRGKAHYNMAKALAMLGEMDLSKISVECDPTLVKVWREGTAKIWDAVFDPSVGKGPMNFSKRKPETWDFIKTDAIEHTYIEGRGRGLRAKRNIDSNDLLVVDHQISIEGVKFNKSRQIDLSFHRTGPLVNKAYVDLVIKILALVKHDGLLGKKIQCLESREKLDEESLSLIDLEWMSYRKFSYDVPPFLPQTPEVVGCDMTNLTEPFVDKIVGINAFGDGEPKLSLEGGIQLLLMISLVNHDENPNCEVLEDSNMSRLVAKRRIRKGEELTISYGPDTTRWGF